MDSQQRLLCKQLVSMESNEAADWLINKYPIDGSYGEALLLISHRSWKKSDQKRLANYYLRNIPFSSSRGYEAFASFMSLRLLLSCVRAHLPEDKQRLALLLYYLVPVLEQAAKNNSDRNLIADFIKEVS